MIFPPLGVNMKITKLFLLLITASLVSACLNTPDASNGSDALTSPDKQLVAKVFTNDQGQLLYSIDYKQQPVLLQSELGLQLTNADFTQGVSIKKQSAVSQVSDAYEMRVGKKRKITYTANQQEFLIENKQQQTMKVIFRLSDHGVAFRYSIIDPTIGNKKFVKETTSFQLSADTRAWLQPMSVAQTGWSNTNPSYEENYQQDIPVGTKATLKQGWVFPALFKSGENWIVISETGLDSSWHASHLDLGDSKGEYQLVPPQPEEVFISATGEKGELLANSTGELHSPWRIVAIGSLTDVMQSTLGTDLATPAVAMDTSFIKPGHSSWSWAILKDDYTTFDVQKKFIDYAADMHWDYTLIDADWDQKIGYEKLQQLVDYATKKNIGILVWYNSSGDWNQSPMTPKSKLLTHQQRVAEFSRLQKIGVKGVKVDFFGGDGQSFMAYYINIIEDAAAHGLSVNFHGATLPRGWHRTYPNLMTMESIKGFEFTTFTQNNQDQVAAHVVTALFTRNLFDPMDYTPMAFGDIPNIKRVTENSFELAESVLMLSGIQHFAEIPEGMATAPDYVKNFLRDLPTEWDDVKFIEGYPGKYVVIARRAGNNWYLAGINAEKDARTIEMDLSFAKASSASSIRSGTNGPRSFQLEKLDINKPYKITLNHAQGFVIKLSN
jgi:alpha-glucosidase